MRARAPIAARAPMKAPASTLAVASTCADGSTVAVGATPGSTGSAGCSSCAAYANHAYGWSTTTSTGSRSPAVDNWRALSADTTTAAARVVSASLR